MHPLLDLFEQAVTRVPERIAAGDQNLVLTYAQFRAVVAGLAGQIAAGTARKTVGILAPTSTAAAAAIFACWYAGKTPAPLNFMLAPAELQRIVRDADIELILTIPHFAKRVDDASRTLMLDARSLTPGSMPTPTASAGDLGGLIYTSGTSADPKGVELTFGNLASNAQGCIAHARITPDQVFLSVLPQFHSFGFTAMTVVPITLGATVWYLPRFTPASVIETIQQRQVTIFMAVASMYGPLARLRGADAGALHSLRLAISGGEPLPDAIAGAFKERFGIGIMEGYGLTETSPVVSINLPWNGRAKSVGRPLPGITVQAVDEQANPLPAGAQGELTVRGPCVMKGYHDKPRETGQVIRDGVFFTGDIGRVDSDGFVFITGRIKEMLIIAGENVFPREIEAVLEQHPAVAEVAVIGARDERHGELPVAFVILQPEATATPLELRDFCRAHLAAYKVPREIRVAENLPRAASGKILKRALQA